MLLVCRRLRAKGDVPNQAAVTIKERDHGLVSPGVVTTALGAAALGLNFRPDDEKRFIVERDQARNPELLLETSFPSYSPLFIEGDDINTFSHLDRLVEISLGHYGEVIGSCRWNNPILARTLHLVFVSVV